MTRFEWNLGAAVSAYNRVARRRGTRELTADDVARIKTRALLRGTGRRAVHPTDK